MDCVTTMKLTDKKELVKLLSFLAMGDGSVHKNGGTKNCVMSLAATEDHLDFVQWAAELMTSITGCSYSLTERASPRKNVYKLQTKSHPFFNDLRDRIYTNSYKGLDPHALKLLDYEALAILYMCDGCLGKYEDTKGKITYTTTLNLCRLSYGDQLLLKKCLKDKLGLEWNVVRTNRKYFTLRLRAKDHNKFMEGIAPYILPSFKYKLEFRTIGPENSGDDIV